ncbi:Probable inactive purple acid phosphatase 29 [Striga hermonthica]|uniref:Probable inactive purple acid phosphatase 29 n=1 Tax=Striga hermonthica TaxID=68872 RepID=A0A9N7R524_STRHE|nr:Probable inactive purple acid phosphatase 29 [Striga hermonthica]
MFFPEAKKMGTAAVMVLIALLCCDVAAAGHQRRQLRFDGKKGDFRILQVADMHFADGRKTPCEDVFPQQMKTCSDLNTTAFIRRLIRAEKPDFIVFTGDNIYGFDASDAAASMNAAFAPAVSSNIPWAAVLGNHDQESTLSREGVMKHIVGMKNTLSQLNPPGVRIIDGFGNYNLEVHGVEGSHLENKSVMNLYFLDSGDYSTTPLIPGYGWIKPSQQLWFQRTSLKIRRSYMNKPEQQNGPAPGLAYFHIPLPEYASFDSSNFTGGKQEGISSASVNSGFFTTMVAAGDVRAVFTGHDHLNDFCGQLNGINLCYAGGFGYHAYGKAGWARRARMVIASLEKTGKGLWGPVKSIKTWKRLDDEHLTAVDGQVLWAKQW